MSDTPLYESVRVAVRLRPTRTVEKDSAVVNIDGQSLVISEPGKPTPLEAAYDYVFGPDVQQHTVFDCFRQAVEGAAQGQNATILAYGPTGTGKTHTMLGAGLEDVLKRGVESDLDSAAWSSVSSGWGVIPRAVHLLLSLLEEHSGHATARPTMDRSPSADDRLRELEAAVAMGDGASRSRLDTAASWDGGVGVDDDPTAGAPPHSGPGSPHAFTGHQHSTPRPSVRTVATVHVSYLQVYNDDVYDLLDGVAGGVYVEDREDGLKGSGGTAKGMANGMRQKGKAGTGAVSGLRSGHAAGLASGPLRIREVRGPPGTVGALDALHGTGAGQGPKGLASSRILRDTRALQTGGVSLDPQGDVSVHVVGLSYHKVASVRDVLHLLSVGAARRAVRSTEYNPDSSRSHAVLQLRVRVDSFSIDSGQPVSSRSSLLNLVDLAGSERWSDTTAQVGAKGTGAWAVAGFRGTATLRGNTLDATSSSLLRPAAAESAREREMVAINRSLSALGNVVAALADASAKVSGYGYEGGETPTAGPARGFVPYRDSALTRLLRDGLGWGARTVLIATIAPSASALDETLSTLAFASRARTVRGLVRSNHAVPESVLLAQARQEIARLQEELALARGMGSGGINTSQEVPPRWAAVPSDQPLRKLPSSPGSPKWAVSPPHLHPGKIIVDDDHSRQDRLASAVEAVLAVLSAPPSPAASRLALSPQDPNAPAASRTSQGQLDSPGFRLDHSQAKPTDHGHDSSLFSVGELEDVLAVLKEARSPRAAEARRGGMASPRAGREHHRDENQAHAADDDVDDVLGLLMTARRSGRPQEYHGQDTPTHMAAASSQSTSPTAASPRVDGRDRVHRSPRSPPRSPRAVVHGHIRTSPVRAGVAVRGSASPTETPQRYDPGRLPSRARVVSYPAPPPPSIPISPGQGAHGALTSPARGLVGRPAVEEEEDRQPHVESRPVIVLQAVPNPVPRSPFRPAPSVAHSMGSPRPPVSDRGRVAPPEPATRLSPSSAFPSSSTGLSMSHTSRGRVLHPSEAPLGLAGSLQAYMMAALLAREESTGKGQEEARGSAHHLTHTATAPSPLVRFVVEDRPVMAAPPTATPSHHNDDVEAGWVDSRASPHVPRSHLPRQAEPVPVIMAAYAEQPQPQAMVDMEADDGQEALRKLLGAGGGGYDDTKAAGQGGAVFTVQPAATPAGPLPFPASIPARPTSFGPIAVDAAEELRRDMSHIISPPHAAKAAGGGTKGKAGTAVAERRPSSRASAGAPPATPATKPRPAKGVQAQSYSAATNQPLSYQAHTEEDYGESSALSSRLAELQARVLASMAQADEALGAGSGSEGQAWVTTRVKTEPYVAARPRSGISTGGDLSSRIAAFLASKGALA